MIQKTHGSAVLGFPAVVKLPAAFLVLPRPGSSRVATDPVGSYPTGALPVVIGSCFIASSTSTKRQTHYFFVFWIITGTRWVGHHYCRLQCPLHKEDQIPRASLSDEVCMELWFLVKGRPFHVHRSPIWKRYMNRPMYPSPIVIYSQLKLMMVMDREIAHGWSQWSTLLCRSSVIP